MGSAGIHNLSIGKTNAKIPMAQTEKDSDTSHGSRNVLILEFDIIKYTYSLIKHNSYYITNSQNII